MKSISNEGAVEAAGTPKSRGEFARLYLENGKSYEHVSGIRDTVFLWLYDAMLRLAADLKAMAGARGPEVSRTKKAPRS